jgi:preprotein translocase subunit SecE
MATKSVKRIQRKSGGGKGGKGGKSAKNPPAAKQRAPEAAKSGIIASAVQFLREVKTELKKVTWPTKKQTVSSTAVVVVLVIIIAAYLGVVDMLLAQLVDAVLPG